MTMEIKKIAMIPARMGSQRVKKKNVRMILGKPLIAYVVESCLEAKVFDAIYINSENSVFEEIAHEYGVSFYRRPAQHSSDSATNDDFALDFIQNVPGNVLFQLLPTSPLISAEEIRAFVNRMLAEDYDALVSVKHEQISCIYKNRPINFDPLKIVPLSQEQEPIKAYATALMAWKYESFIDNMKKYGAAYHGGQGKVGYFELRGLSTVDIDQEEDFELAEQILIAQRMNLKPSSTPRYYGETESGRTELDITGIMKRDGVEITNLKEANREKIRVKDVIESYPKDKSWNHQVINTESNSMSIISQNPGEGNRKHYHPDWNEWWYIVEGEWEWEIEGTKKIISAGEIVFIPKGVVHQITVIGEKRAIRMAVSRADVEHVYV